MNPLPLKILIVDDEEPTRKLLSACLQQSDLDLQIVGEAVSGQEALNFMEEDTAPDLLITDIRMPYMDGLELSRIVAERYPNTRIVIMTAFRDFSYAQQSISIGVSDFLLKPVKRSELFSVIVRLQDEIAEEKQRWLEYDHLRSILAQNYDYFRERFLLSFLENSERTSDTERQIAYYFPAGTPGHIQVILLEILADSLTELSEDERLLRNMKTQEYLKQSLDDCAEMDILIDKDCVILLSYSSELEAVSLCNRLCQQIFQSSGWKICFGIGSGYADFYQITLSFQEAVESLKYSRYMADTPISVYRDDLYLGTPSWHLPIQAINELCFYIKAGMPDKIQELVPGLYQDAAQQPIQDENARLLSMILMTSAISVASEIGLTMSDLLTGKQMEAFLALPQSDGQTLCVRITAYLAQLADSISAQRTSKNQSVITGILQYIQNDLANPELSLTKLSELFHMNSSYLSRLFKKETDMSFSKYLYRLRMEKALQLIHSTDMKAYQIGEAVGIPDAYYFSNCFKKYTGKSIRDYKKGS